MLLKGQSGASITMLNGIVEKTGDSPELIARLDREMQHILLMRNADTDLFPKIKYQGSNGYAMEKLHCLPDRSGRDVERVLGRLRKNVWPRHVAPYHIEKREWRKPFMEWLFQNVDGVTLALFIRLDSAWPHLFADIDLIHGDPTLENTMYRDAEGSDIVLIDPVAGDPKLPRSRYLDVGKMLQSAMGYEKFKYPEVFKYEPYHLVQIILRAFNNEERAVSLFWCMIHHYRIIVRLQSRNEYEALSSDPAMIRYCQTNIEALKWMLLPLCP